MSRARAKSDGPDVASEVRATLAIAVGVIRKQVEKLARAKKPDTAELARLAAALSPILGQLRRYDEAVAAAGNKLAPAAVIAFLRGLPAPKRRAILAEVDDDQDDGAQGSVLA